MSDPDNHNFIQIKGGAGPFEAAAITAVIAQVVRDEQSLAATPTHRHQLSEWSVTGRHDVFVLPIAPTPRLTTTRLKSNRHGGFR